MTPGIDLIQRLSVLYAGTARPPDEAVDIVGRVAGRLCAAAGLEQVMACLDSARPPDLAIVDIDGGDGLALAGRIRERHSGLPLILTGADPDSHILLKAISIGTARFITKPFGEAELIEALALAAAAIQRRAAGKDYSLTRKILDHSPDYVLITDGQCVDFINRPLLDVLGCRDCSDIPTCSILEERLDLARKESVTDSVAFSQWLRTAIGDPSREHVVFLAGHDGKRTFLLRAKRLDEPLAGRFMVSFTDITSIEQERQHYHEMAIRDPLTKAFNRMKFSNELDLEMARAQRYGTPLSLIMLDIDDFKAVNDMFGHQAGDMVLVEMVGLMRQKVRVIDLVARWGGEEFLIILPQTDLEGAGIAAEKLRLAVAGHAFGDLPRVTCSFGVGALGKDESPQDIIRRVDQALYRAKAAGKNTIHCAD